MNKIIDKKMFEQDALSVAKNVLGKIIVRKTESGEILKGRITEIEIYKQDDSACHAFKGKTKRNAPMFESGGTIYVYLCYGLFNLLNIVCNVEDIPQALLIRGIDDVFGSGRVSKLLKIDKSLNNENLLTSDKIWLEDDGYILSANKIQKNKRVGIAYAKPIDQDRLWRWRIINKKLLFNK